jgi:hypothetical protein
LVLLAFASCASSTPPPAAPQQPAPLYVVPPPDPHAAPVPPPPPSRPPPQEQIAVAPPVINSVFASDLPLLPVDSELVVGINAAKLQQSALWATFSPRLTAKLAWLPMFTKTCGFDPITGLSTITMGLKGLKNSQPEGVIVVHGLPTTKLGTCLTKLRLLAKGSTKLTVDGDTFKLADKDASATFGFTDASTMVAVIGPNASKASWEAAKAGTSALSTSPAFMSMLAQINPNDAVVALMNTSTTNVTQQLGVKSKAIFGSLDAADSLTMDFRLRLETADEANQLTQMVQGQINNPQMKTMFTRFDVIADGADVKFGITMPAQTLQMIAGMIP